MKAQWLIAMRKAAFYDRDGTINVDIGYLHESDKLVFISGVPELIRFYNDANYLVIVITNQSGIGRGIYDQETMQNLNSTMNERLQLEYGAHIDAFYFCPHLPEDNCKCRKPKPGLFFQAIKNYDIDSSASISYGDSFRDKVASESASIGEFRYIKDFIASTA